jgi:hypothetical protein
MLAAFARCGAAKGQQQVAPGAHSLQQGGIFGSSIHTVSIAISVRVTVMAGELVIQSRVFDLLVWLLPKSERFPRSYRFSLTQRMMDAALDLQDALIGAETQRGQGRRRALVEADRHLARLRVYLRLAHHWQWLNDGQYAHVSRMVLEIGRLLGGWLRREAGQ